MRPAVMQGYAAKGAALAGERASLQENGAMYHFSNERPVALKNRVGST
jgi:hypothetical protein